MSLNTFAKVICWHNCNTLAQSSRFSPIGGKWRLRANRRNSRNFSPSVPFTIFPLPNASNLFFPKNGLKNADWLYNYTSLFQLLAFFLGIQVTFLHARIAAPHAKVSQNGAFSKSSRTSHQRCALAQEPWVGLLAVRIRQQKIICLWLVVSTHLKNMSQTGNLPQVGVKIKNVSNHHLDLGLY